MEGKWSNWSVLCLKLPTIITPLCPNLHKNSGLKWYSWIWIDYDGIELIFSTNFNIETLEICINLCHLVCGMKTWKHAFMTALIEYKYLSICTLISVSYKYWKEEDNFAGFHDFMISWIHAVMLLYPLPTSTRHCNWFSLSRFLKGWRYTYIISYIEITSSKDKKLSLEGKWSNWSFLWFQVGFIITNSCSIQERIFIDLDRLWCYWTNLQYKFQ